MPGVSVAEGRRSWALCQSDEWAGVGEWLSLLSGVLTVVFVLYLFLVG